MDLSAVHAGLDTLRANPMRTMLSTLGVIMGAASLVGALSLGDGAEAFARKRIQQEGYNHVVVEPITSDSVDGEHIARAAITSIEPSDADALRPLVDGRASGHLIAQGSLLWTPPAGGLPRGLRVVGLRPIGNSMLPSSPLVGGRMLSADEARTDGAVCVVSQRLATLLTAGGTPGSPAAPSNTATGMAIAVSGRQWQVVGVQEDLAGDKGFVLVVPIAAAVSLLPATPRRIAVEATHIEDVERLTDDIRRWADERGWHDTVRVAAPGQQRLNEIARSFLWFKMLMGAFTAISLLVGGIGIMNVLLASVIERTREIGIRKAVGARGRDIRLQFLTESVTIATAGSLIGLAAGLAGTFALTAFMRAKTGVPMYAGVSWSTLAASATSALLVGLVFGTYPAIRASRLAPIDAIQRE